MGTTTEHTGHPRLRTHAEEDQGGRLGDVREQLGRAGTPRPSTAAAADHQPARPRTAEPIPGPSPQTLNATRSFNTGELPPNVPASAAGGAPPPEAARSFTFVVPDAGRYEYSCILHVPSGMAGNDRARADPDQPDGDPATASAVRRCQVRGVAEHAVVRRGRARSPPTGPRRRRRARTGPSAPARCGGLRLPCNTTRSFPRAGRPRSPGGTRGERHTTPRTRGRPAARIAARPPIEWPRGPREVAAFPAIRSSAYSTSASGRRRRRSSRDGGIASGPPRSRATVAGCPSRTGIIRTGGPTTRPPIGA